jgi:hypothetical protein
VNYKESAKELHKGGNAIFSAHFHAINQQEERKPSQFMVYTADQKKKWRKIVSIHQRKKSPSARLAIFINFMRIEIALMIFQNWLFMFTHKRNKNALNKRIE